MCRKLLVEKNAHLTLLQALRTADFEELPLKHDICEVLSKLGASDPDTSSTVRRSGLASAMPIREVQSEIHIGFSACSSICPNNFASWSCRVGSCFFTGRHSLGMLICAGGICDRFPWWILRTSEATRLSIWRSATIAGVLTRLHKRIDRRDTAGKSYVYLTMLVF